MCLPKKPIWIQIWETAQNACLRMWIARSRHANRAGKVVYRSITRVRFLENPPKNRNSHVFPTTAAAENFVNL
jgi:hypothetical protein